jgi:alkylated DNA repair dioxygenase AlkB
MQNSLFNQSNSSDSICLLEKDGRAEYFHHFYDVDESNHLYKCLLSSLLWEADEIKMFGNLVRTARKVAWVGDPECTYTYSGVQKTPQAWTHELLQMLA